MPWRLAGVLLALFLSIFSQTIVATAMPRIIADLGGFDRYTWPATAYLVATAVAVPIVGRLSDIHGRRRFLILGLVVFTLSSIPAGLSQSMTQLVAFRLLQGIGGGLVAASSFAAAADLFPPQGRGRFEAYAGLTSGIAAVTGPLLGGFITDRFAWNWIFFLNVPVGLLVLATVLAFPKIRSEVEDRRLDYPGMATLVLAVASVMTGLSWGSGGPPATGLVAFGVAMAAVFVFIEWRSDHPVMPLEIYRNPAVAVSLAAVFLSAFGLYGSLLFTPLFFQGALGASAAGSGRVLAPIVVGLVVGNVISGQLIARTGGYYRAQAVAGIATLAAGMFLLSNHEPGTPAWSGAWAACSSPASGCGRHPVDLPAGRSELGAVQPGGGGHVRPAVHPAAERHGRARRTRRRAVSQPLDAAGRGAPRKRQGRNAAGASRRHQGRPSSAGGPGWGRRPDGWTGGHRTGRRLQWHTALSTFSTPHWRERSATCS